VIGTLALSITSNAEPLSFDNIPDRSLRVQRYDMSVLPALKRRILGCRICIPALFTTGIATTAIVYGFLTDDVVTALGALLLVPSAILLFAIGLRRENAVRSDRRAN
jgi:hypothetical protein